MERPAPTAEEVRNALDCVLRSAGFAGSRRSGDLLRYVVEAALKTPDRTIKEQELGAEALGRGDRFDPRFDPIARVEASRLRGRLAHYYATEGAADPVRIDLPKGGYSPAFTRREAAPAALPTPASAGGWRANPLVWMGAGVALASVVFLGAALMFRPAPSQASPGNVAMFDAALGAPGVLADQVGNSLALSPDGQTLVTVMLGADQRMRLYARKLDSIEAIELPGTDGAYQPFFSPDGRWVGFFSGNQIRKTLVDGGGTPVSLAEATDTQGMSWLDNGTIVASTSRDSTFMVVAENGGPATSMAVETSDGVWTGWPQALPRGKGILFTAVDRRNGKRRIEAVRSDGKGRVIIADVGTYPRYSPTGDVLYVDRGSLFAVMFDIDSFAVKGPPRLVLRDVTYREPFGHAFFDVSSDGKLVYLRSRPSRIVWLDGGDKERPLLSEPNRYLFPRPSPDGRRVAYGVSEGAGYVLYAIDTRTGDKQRIGPPDSGEGNPIWTQDGQNLIVLTNRELAIAWRRADGTGDAHAIIPGINVPWSMSASGDRIAYHALSLTTHFDIWTAPISSGPDGVKAGPPELYLSTPAIETFPAISPDGKWMAYNSNISGEFSVYVDAFPVGGKPVKLATGGRAAVWSGNSRIFHTTGDHRLMVATYSVKNGEFVPGPSRQWSDVQLADTGVVANFYLAADGKSIIALVPDLPKGSRERDHATFALNLAGLLDRAR